MPEVVPEYTDVMLDLETLGTLPGCAIVSIGAVAFNEFGVDTLGFYKVIDVPDWSEPGLTHEGLFKDEKTIEWWNERSEEARAIFNAPMQRTNTYAAIWSLAQYLAGFGSPRVWGNGADFDNPIVFAAAAKVGLRPKDVWGVYNGRCYRTVKSQFRDTKLVRVGTHHNALDDARSQAQHMVEICQKRGWRLV